MAPKKSEVISLWYDEFTRAITIGFRLYGKEVDKESCIVPQLRGNLYHTQYKCIQMVLHRRLNRKANIIMKSASDTAYKLHTDCDWDSYCVMTELKENTEQMKRRMPCIKLIAADRKTGINISNYFTTKTA
jgi:hypothetical protein